MQILEQIIRAAHVLGASDIHLQVLSPPTVRIDGDLSTMNFPVLAARDMQQIIDDLFENGVLKRSDFAASEHTPHADADFALTSPVGTRVRGNAFVAASGPCIALRLMPAHPPSLQDIEAPKQIRDLTNLPHGLVLITGPTGSGKSTTSAAMINEMNMQQRRHIITIEDPIEYLHENKTCLITQRQVGLHTPSFSMALRSALREDPDVIFVGELRDRDSISLALIAAETGHLVLGTLHSPSASQAIDRLIGVFEGTEKTAIRLQLATSLSAVIGQRLMKRRKSGRIAAMEILLATPAVRNQIKDDKIALLHQTIEMSNSLGMQTLNQAIETLEMAGVI